MPLSNEDSLRLNVLLAQKVSAIRIDEGKLMLYALTQKGEAKIQLNPTVRNAKYIKEVKDFLSTKALGAPGGFPMFISRWNRMGDLRNSSLDKLLLLGEEEAVAAVVNNKSITPEIAKSAWWAIQSAENARSMLANEVVVQSEFGTELANFLIEFLPFEEDPLSMLSSARLVLQEGLISDEEVLKLWKKGKSKTTLYVGFLDIRPDAIPEQSDEHHQYQASFAKLSALVAEDNPYALMLNKLLSASGQTFLKTAEASFKRPPNYDIVAALIESIRRYVFVKQAEAGQSQQHHELSLSLQGEPETDINAIHSFSQAIFHAENELCCSDALKSVQQTVPELAEQLQAILFLGRTSQTVLAPTIANSTAVGSLMRKKLKPVFDPIITNLRLLQL
ncbi:sulfur reduction protein DsrS [sulfur-oxidizing endosymbiont of Gigantopelta aegis]|uniref:sulfur reduction protein DsrS n=1 Tax=sulfur-oxidizing endosymbiont of Gigantopelta aegis TaxID=2794934 RepID=UPI0018DB5B86|nr:sulfur reduction protein DsrS [sulfur-oxidizing endosymbiont of Gigantopelta aegis]